MRRRAAAFVIVAALALAGGCSVGPNPPAVGDTWQIEAVDTTGAFGTITIERGRIVALPAGARDVEFPGATQAITLHITYASDRASTTGFGQPDWASWIGDEDVPENGGRFLGVVLRDGQAVLDGPVLGDVPPGVEQELSGWMLIPVSPEDLAGKVRLVYKPFIIPDGGNRRPQVVTDVTVYAP